MPFRVATNRVATPEHARAVQAYLLTKTEGFGDHPVYGDAFMQDIITGFSSPEELRALLPPSLRGRYDWWLAELKTVQLDLFEDS